MELTAEDRQGMSPAELELLAEGLEADGTPREEGSAVQAAPEESDDDPDDEPAAAPAALAAKAETAAEPAPAAEAAAQAAADNDQDDEPAPAAPAPFVPQYSAEVPADAAQQIAALKAEERAAFAKLMDGDSDMDTEAYAAIKDRTEAAIDDLKTKALTASIFKQATEQAAEQRAREEWNAAKAACFATFKAQGQDYSDPAKPGLLAAYNHHLKALGSDPANENKDGQWFLQEAHRLTRADLGLAAAAPTPPAPRPAAPPRGVDRNAIPPTLSRVPPAADANIAGDEFAHLQGLDGTALEKAIAGMTPDQLERYLP